ASPRLASWRPLSTFWRPLSTSWRPLSTFWRPPRLAEVALMKAAYHTEFGPPSVMKVGEREKPVPGPREVLVRVHASSVNKADFYRVAGSPGIVRLFSGAFFGPPKSIPGH